jgi:hypothetical protein
LSWHERTHHDHREKRQAGRDNSIKNLSDESLLNNFGEQTGRRGHNRVEYALSIEAAKELSR